MGDSTSFNSRNSLGGSSSMTTGNTANSNNRFRASVDNAAGAGRSQYSTGGLSGGTGPGAGVGHQSLQPGAAGMASLGLGQSPSGSHINNNGNSAASTSKRPSSEMLASFAAGATNAESESDFFAWTQMFGHL